MKPWSIFAASELGNRETNNDSFEIFSFKYKRRSYYSIIVSDGVGKPAENGDCARTVVAAASKAVRLFVQSRVSRRPFKSADCSILYACLTDQFGHIHGQQNCAATFALALFSYRTVLVAWSGDSRIYGLLSNGSLNQLTDDHSDRHGDITNFIQGNGDIHGGVDVRYYAMGRMIAIVGTTDGVHGYCSSRELILFLIYCIANVGYQQSFLERDLRIFLKENLSDNATIAVVCRRQSLHHLSYISNNLIAKMRLIGGVTAPV